MFTIKDINIEEDKVVNSNPVCLRKENSGDIYCLGVLAEREIISGRYDGRRYYQFVWFWGRSPVNFIAYDYRKLQQEYSFNIDLEMIADFRYGYSAYKVNPGLDSEVDIMRIDKSYRI